MEYGQKLYENWSTLPSNLNEDFSVTQKRRFCGEGESGARKL